ncbi:type II secretion system minor pseudopilin GspJ [Sphingomonas sp. LY160]|uniref:type II secretion system minor pseudopilin GspJ n=1 Tax=Sphingomonas sp. LY160 TaxID=3095342 RepID=UPI002ADEAC3F|nr:type II secretion system minor pseudopilin GspJ [Sphingomonas sp. LY160]MEA1072876.1 type II secretion system minor pseudopilin GspJ [Sphingomonas sp. LY160]
MQREEGFTLVEMMVALVIFAILAAAGVMILRSSVDTQTAVEARLADVSDTGRLHALLTGDLAQAVDRSTRDGNEVRPPFVGDANQMQFVRSGWQNIDDEARSSLQRVQWRVEGGGLARIGHRGLDRGEEAAPALMAKDATAAFRYRSADGNWSGSYASTPERPLPAAVELVLTPKGAPAVTMVFALPDVRKKLTPESGLAKPPPGNAA